MIRISRLFVAVALLGIWLVTVSQAIQAPPKADQMIKITPDPNGVFDPPEKKLDSLEYLDQPAEYVLIPLSQVYGIEIYLPSSAANLKVTVKLKKVTYREIIEYMFRGSDYEIIFQHPKVLIRRHGPNQALERNDPSRHAGCCAPVAPAGVVAHL